MTLRTIINCCLNEGLDFEDEVDDVKKLFNPNFLV